MTRGTYPKSIESAEHDFVLIKGLTDSNKAMKEAIKEVIELLDGEGVPNTTWIKNRLIEGLEFES